MKDKVKESKILVIAYIIISFVFVLPSIIYLKNKGTLFFYTGECSFLFNDGIEPKIQAIVYLVVLVMMIILYYIILKRRNYIFHNMKSVYLYIGIVSLIFVILTPFLCSDIFYYLGIGRLSGEYHQNPYYITMNEYMKNSTNNFENDTAFLQGGYNYWADTTVVYGPVWTLICTILAKLSFGNVDIGVFLFKLANLVVHILNCVFIYKLSGKKIFVILYGLNPFVLIEGIGEVHNDMFMLLFTILSIYMVKNKKNIWYSLIFLSLATNIKFSMILILPFIVLYYLKNEKIGKRIIGCLKYGIFFGVVMLIPYIFYYQDINIFLCMMVQRERFARGILSFLYFSEINKDTVFLVRNIVTILFVIWYFCKCVKLLLCEKIKFIDEMKSCMGIVFIFIICLLTNCQIWYLLWLNAFIVWQKPWTIKTITWMQLLTQIGNYIFIYNNSGGANSEIAFFEIMVFGMIIYMILIDIIKRRKIKNLNTLIK